MVDDPGDEARKELLSNRAVLQETGRGVKNKSVLEKIHRAEEKRVRVTE